MYPHMISFQFQNHQPPQQHLLPRPFHTVCLKSEPRAFYPQYISSHHITPQPSSGHQAAHPRIDQAPFLLWTGQTYTPYDLARKPQPCASCSISSPIQESTRLELDFSPTIHDQPHFQRVSSHKRNLNGSSIDLRLVCNWSFVILCCFCHVGGLFSSEGIIIGETSQR